MNVSFFDPRPEPKIALEIEKAVASVLASGRYILGEHGKALEDGFASYCGVQNAISVASGTDALFLALKALNVGFGHEVITTPFSFVATASAILNAGARPVFVDIERATFNLNPDLVERAITDRTRAILPVHLFGLPANMEALASIVEGTDIALIEDAAQAVGARIGNWKVGSMGDVACFSFYPTKNLGACGDGGMVTARDPLHTQIIDKLRRQGSSQKYYAEQVGINSRLDEIQAVILRVKMRYLGDWTQRRLEIACAYRDRIHGVVHPTFVDSRYLHVYHQYTIRIPAAFRDKVRAILQREGIGTAIYYPVPLHLQPAFRHLANTSFPEAEHASVEVLSLPIYPGLTDAQVKHVARAVNGALVEAMR